MLPYIFEKSERPFEILFGTRKVKEENPMLWAHK